MHIHLIEAFHTGSHRQWALQLKDHSKHEIEIISLPGRHWKWRMQSSAFPLAQKSNSLPPPHAFLLTDMVNVPEFRSFLKEDRRNLPIYLYMHENQITYPWSPDDQDLNLNRDHTYGLINCKSALSADKIFFNSNYHLHSFLNGLPDFLGKFPDSAFGNMSEKIKKKSHVLPIGIEMQSIERKSLSSPPVILWNHRWEYDKGPELFFSILKELREDNYNFQLIVCGAHGNKIPSVFREAREIFKKEIVHWGYVKDKKEYARLLKRSDILPVTSVQDFFGISVVEAISHRVYPLLPHRLAFPEHIPARLHEQYLYGADASLADQLRSWLDKPKQVHEELIQHIQKYNWRQLIDSYDTHLSNYFL